MAGHALQLFAPAAGREAVSPAVCSAKKRRKRKAKPPRSLTNFLGSGGARRGDTVAYLLCIHLLHCACVDAARARPMRPEAL